MLLARLIASPWVLLPMVGGHLGSAGLVAALALSGAPLDRRWLPWVAIGALILVLATRLARRTRHQSGAWTGPMGLAVWSFTVSTVHGAGLMWVPALLPLCVGGTTGSRSSIAGDLWMAALAGVAVHALAMLAVTAATAGIANWILNAVPWPAARMSARFDGHRQAPAGRCGRLCMPAQHLMPTPPTR